jgi:hypothetical protein
LSFDGSFSVEEDSEPGLPAAPVDESLDEVDELAEGLVLDGPVAVDGVVVELLELLGGVVVPAVLGGVVGLVDGLVAVPAVDPGVPGLVVSAVDPGRFTSVLRVSSRPASQPASARSIADAMSALLQFIMIVFPL